MKRILLVFSFLLAAGGLWAQQINDNIGQHDPSRLGVTEAQQYLKEVSVDKFERDGFWVASISSDDGYVTSRLFNGGPMNKQPIPEEEGLDIPDEHVLGVRVDFLRRGHTNFVVKPLRSIPIEGITKTVSVWVAGRNHNHELKLMVEDFFGRRFELSMGRLNFQGWKQMTAVIPPQGHDGYSGIVQRNYNYNNLMGLKIIGFRIVVYPWEAFGSYYIYFDDLRAVTDMFAEMNRDPDDMQDAW